jgi:8-oxo-dGTP pyrophosphatase MutT (NUDIX family)
MNSQWSHAGGVVRRTTNGKTEYLLVAASDNPDIWVLPKGHIKKRETPEDAAIREIEEEAGVRASIVARAGETEFGVRGKTVRCVFFLMQYQAETGAEEDRAVAWRSYDDALDLLEFENSRQILKLAHTLKSEIR